MASNGVGTASSPILIDDDSDTEVEAQILPVPHPQPQPQLDLSSGAHQRPRGPTTPRAPRAMEEKRKGKKIASDTVGFQMLMHMGYEPGKGLGLELEGPSEPLAPEPHPVFKKLGLGGVPGNGSKEKLTAAPTPAPELEQDIGNAKPLTKKQRKLVAQAERIAQARSQPQAGPLKHIPRAPRAMSKPPPTGPKNLLNAPNQEPMQTQDQDAVYFMHQPAGFFANPQAVMQMQMAQTGVGMPFFQSMFDPMLGLPVDPTFLAARQGMAFNPDFFAPQFGHHMPHSPVLPTGPRAARNRSASTQKPPSTASSTNAPPPTSTKLGIEPTSTSDKGGEYTIRGITYRPALGPIGVQASPDADYTSRNGGIPGSFKYYPELSFTTDASRTVVFETMPRKFRTLAFIESWAAQFAECDSQGEPAVQTSQVLLRDTKALVEFTTVAGAARAFASPRMNGNGGQPGIRAYAYVPPGGKPQDPPFVQLAMASPQWRDVVTPRDIVKRDNELVRAAVKPFGPEDEDISRQLAARREKGKGKGRGKGKGKEVPQAPMDDDLEEGEVVETPPIRPRPLAHPRASTSSTTPTAPKNQNKASAHLKLESKSPVVQTRTMASASGAKQDPDLLSAVLAAQDSAAYEAALRSRIKTRALKRTRDEAFGPQPPPPPPAPSTSTSAQPPPPAPVPRPQTELIASSSSSSSRSTSTPALTPTSATFSAPYVPSTPSFSTTESTTTTQPPDLITFDVDAFLMDTLRDAKRQRVLPEEPRAAFAFHCARRDELLTEFNAVMAQQAAATDRESKRALSLHLKEIMTDLELTRKAVNATKALIDASNADSTPAPPSPVAQRRTSPPNRISMSPQPAYNLDNIVGDVLPTLTPGCVFPNPTEDSMFVFTWEEDDEDDMEQA